LSLPHYDRFVLAIGNIKLLKEIDLFVKLIWVQMVFGKDLFGEGNKKDRAIKMILPLWSANSISTK